MLIDDLNVNSADLVEIVLEVEQHFSIVIDDSEIDNLRTIGQVVDLVMARTQAA